MTRWIVVLLASTCMALAALVAGGYQATDGEVVLADPGCCKGG